FFTPVTCWKTPCTPQKQPPANTAFSVVALAASSIAGGGMTTTSSAAWLKVEVITRKVAAMTVAPAMAKNGVDFFRVLSAAAVDMGFLRNGLAAGRLPDCLDMRSCFMSRD